MPCRPLALDRTPAEILASLADEPGAFSVAVPDPIAPITLVGCAPVAELRVDTATPDPLGAVARFIETSSPLDPTLPFPLGAGIVACLAYELGAWTVPGLGPTAPDGPLAVL